MSAYNDSLGVPVLSYHKVEDNFGNALAIGVNEFEEQMAYLHKKGYTTISPEQLYNYLKKGTPLPPKPVLITFDDGYRDNFVNAYPILKKYGFKATIFLITDEIGGNNDRYLTWEQAIEMRRNGFSFGTHTLSHVELSGVSEDYAMFQLEKSQEAAEWRFDAPVKYFAYPGGAYNSNIENLVEKAGYKAAFSTEFGRVTKTSDIYALERIPIFRSWFTFADFYFRLNFTNVVSGLKMTKGYVWQSKSN